MESQCPSVAENFASTEASFDGPGQVVYGPLSPHKDTTLPNVLLPLSHYRALKTPITDSGGPVSWGVTVPGSLLNPSRCVTVPHNHPEVHNRVKESGK